MNCRINTTVVVITCFVLLGARASLASHSAITLVGHDPVLSFYAGTSNPSGTYQINLQNGSPGYLNGISGGQDAGSAGGVMITSTPTGSMYLVGVAIQVTDTAGPLHSLSTMNDAALGDIVADLNLDSGGDVILHTYPFQSAPSQYSSAEAVLAAGEAANGGQPFDLLLAGTNLGMFGGFDVWTFDFHNEVGNLDGITALNVTDVGAIPEPAASSLAVAGAALLFRRRRSRC
jgi:hypothetical protein